MICTIEFLVFVYFILKGMLTPQSVKTIDVIKRQTLDIIYFLVTMCSVSIFIKVIVYFEAFC